MLTYHPTLRDYMNNTHGKEIPLKHTTVKIPFHATSVGGHKSNHSNNSDHPEKQKESKKNHRRHKSHSISSSAGQTLQSEDESASDQNAQETHFTIVSLDSKEWRFDADTAVDRTEWVAAIEQQIRSSLQGMQSERQQKLAKDQRTGQTSSGERIADEETLRSIRNVPGNDFCADCHTPSE